MIPGDLPLEKGLAVIAGAALIILVLSVLGWRSRGRLFGSLNALLALLFLAAGAVVILAGANILTYHRLSAESNIAALSFEQLGPARYRATMLEYATATESTYVLTGDEWQVDARIIKWTGPAMIAGLDARYRLERISGRYRDVDQEKHAPRSVYGLSSELGLDLWTMLGTWRRYLPWMDTYYGSATYLPMAHEATYEISVSQWGLLARPVNAAAQDAVDRWR